MVSEVGRWRISLSRLTCISCWGRWRGGGSSPRTGCRASSQWPWRRSTPRGPRWGSSWGRAWRRGSRRPSATAEGCWAAAPWPRRGAGHRCPCQRRRPARRPARPCRRRSKPSGSLTASAPSDPEEQRPPSSNFRDEFRSLHGFYSPRSSAGEPAASASGCRLPACRRRAESSSSSGRCSCGQSTPACCAAAVFREAIAIRGRELVLIHGGFSRRKKICLCNLVFERGQTLRVHRRLGDDAVRRRDPNEPAEQGLKIRTRWAGFGYLINGGRDCHKKEGRRRPGNPGGGDRSGTRGASSGWTLSAGPAATRRCGRSSRARRSWWPGWKLRLCTEGERPPFPAQMSKTEIPS